MGCDDAAIHWSYCRALLPPCANHVDVDLRLGVLSSGGGDDLPAPGVDMRRSILRAEPPAEEGGLEKAVACGRLSQSILGYPGASRGRGRGSWGSHVLFCRGLLVLR